MLLTAESHGVFQDCAPSLAPGGMGGGEPLSGSWVDDALPISIL